MHRVVRAGSLLLAGLVAGTVVIGASGWLYLVGPSSRLPGPVIGNALPLDELSHHSAVPLLTLAIVWAAAGLSIGLLARLVRIERLTAALLLAVGVTAYCFVVTGVSLLIVRQIPALDAFHAVARMPAVYLPGALAGLAGALVGSSQRKQRRLAPMLFGTFVALDGIFDIVVAMLPNDQAGVIEQFAPHAVQGVSNALLAPLGLALLVIARGLSRQRRRAWQLAVALLGSSAAIQLTHRIEYGATATVLIGLALVARRDDFAKPGDSTRNSRHTARAALLFAAVYGYGAAALWVNRMTVDQPFTTRFAFHETTAALVGARLHGSAHLSGSFGAWFPLSVFVLGLTVAGIIVAFWLAPWPYRLARDSNGRDRAHALVEGFGVDTLAPFALRADKSYFFSEDERAFLAYKVVAGVAVISGDPIGPEDAVAELLLRFLHFARERDWRIAVLGAGENALHLYRAAGLRVLYHGEEAVVQTAEFSLQGREIRKVRQSVARLEREGYRADVRYARDVDPALRAELEEIFVEWRGSDPVKGFTMELDTLFRLEGESAIFVIGRDPDGRPQGFLHFVVARAGLAVSLSSMPRRRTTPNGLNEWLVVTMIEWARTHGFERVSLNFAPFAALLAADVQQLTSGKRIQRRALGALKGHGFQLENLLAFNRKFFPRWEARYVVYERIVDLPRVGLAGLAAEGYLPPREKHAALDAAGREGALSRRSRTWPLRRDRAVA